MADGTKMGALVFIDFQEFYQEKVAIEITHYDCEGIVCNKQISLTMCVNQTQYAIKCSTYSIKV